MSIPHYVKCVLLSELSVLIDLPVSTVLSHTKEWSSFNHKNVKKKFTSDFYKWRSTLAMAKLDLRLANGNILLKRLSSYVDWHLISCNWNWFRPKLYLLFHFLLNQLKQKKKKKKKGNSNLICDFFCEEKMITSFFRNHLKQIPYFVRGATRLVISCLQVRTNSLLVF